MKRVKVTVKKPNPLFEKWLNDWVAEAALKDSSLEQHLSKALDSLRRYPLPLKSGTECFILEHFNSKLCHILDKKMHEWQLENIHLHREIPNAVSDNVNNDSGKLKTCIVPVAHMSSNNHGNNTENGASKSKLRLIGIENKSVLQHNLFDIILLVDVHEIGRKKITIQRESTTTLLKQLDVLFEVRHLNIGDFAWIAKCRLTNEEFIMPYIVERKRLDDLCSSMKDGRYKKQKFRLRHSGICNLIYIVEKNNKPIVTCIPLSSLMQASVNILLRDGFIVQHTKNHKSTFLYLNRVTNILINIYKEKCLSENTKNSYSFCEASTPSIQLLPYKDFDHNTSTRINVTVREMFVRHLVRLWGISIEQAVSITELYPTPYLLIAAINASKAKQGYILENIPVTGTSKKVTRTAAKNICELYLKKKLT